MKTELTTPKAILIGLSLIAVAIASIPYSKSVVRDAHAENARVTAVTICDRAGKYCGFGTQEGPMFVRVDEYNTWGERLSN
jgi:hypothetical protein